MAGVHPDRWRALDPLLDEALDLAPDARARWLDELRAESPTLAAELGRLLAADAAADRGGFLDRPLAAPLAGPLAGPAPGLRLGPYVVERSLGCGGMGSVWLARRADGRYEGRVAIKFLNLALLGDVGRERFRREGSALARLAHPGIARLLDAGVAAAGQPYLVLEYVEGEWIDAYADARRLATAARVRLTLQVLAAVGHAHAQLVVHRDLKPSNILVTAAGAAKLLDFGIAKLLADDGGEETAPLTSDGGRALTPDFAAPEQLRGEPVTTATDVYAVGVLLYVLLTGRRPHALAGRSAAEMERILGHVEPPRPSATFAAAGPGAEGAAERARPRGGTPERLRRELRGDLDAIVMRALAKEPARRYASAAAFADDLARFLEGRPVAARPDDVAYRVRRFVGRHRAAVAAGCTVAAGLVAATGFSLHQMHEAEGQRDAARVQRDHARWQERRATATSEFLQALLLDVSATGRAPAMPRMLDRARAQLEERLRGDPRLLARVMTDLADSYFPVHEANPLLARAVTLAAAAGDPGMAASAECRMGKMAAEEGDLARARPSVARGLAHLARAAPADPASIGARVQCLRASATLARLEGRPAEAVRDAREAVALGAAVGDTTSVRHLGALNEEARALADAGQLRAALARTRDIIAVLERTNRGTMMGTLYERANVAARLAALGEPGAADTALAAAVGTARGLDPAWQVPPYMLVLAAELDAVRGRHARAAEGFRRAAAAARGGDGVRFAVRALDGLVASLVAAGRRDEAARAAEELRRLAPPGFRWYVALADARLLHARGRTGAARRAFLAVLASRGFPTRAPATPYLPRLALEAARLALADGDAVAADSLAAHAERLALGEGHDEGRSVVLAYARVTRAAAGRGAGRGAVTRDALGRAARVLEEALGADHPWAREARRLEAGATTAGRTR